MNTFRTSLVALTALLLLPCCDPPPTEQTPDPRLPVADTLEPVVKPEPVPPPLSAKDSLSLVQDMMVRLKAELEQARTALTKAEKNRDHIAKSKGGNGDQHARDIRDATIAVEQNQEAIARAEEHLLMLDRTQTRLQAQLDTVK